MEYWIRWLSILQQLCRKSFHRHRFKCWWVRPMMNRSLNFHFLNVPWVIRVDMKGELVVLVHNRGLTHQRITCRTTMVRRSLKYKTRVSTSHQQTIEEIQRQLHKCYNNKNNSCAYFSNNNNHPVVSKIYCNIL